MPDCSFAFIRRFHGDTRGAVAVVFGVSALALVSMIGVALDASRSYNIKSRVQNVLDAASLAGARKLALDDANDGDVTSTALAYFEAQREEFKVWGAIPGAPQVSIDRNKSSVTMTVDVAVSSIAGSLSGLLPQINFSPSATASYDVKRIELAMVLDITGSMNWAGGDGKSKLSGLKEAAEDIIKLLANSAPAANFVKVGLVPYSASVNVGPFHGDVTYETRGDTCVVERDGPDAYNDDPVGAGSHIEVVGAPPPGYYSCPKAEIVPLTDIGTSAGRNFLIDKVKAMSAGGGTAGHIGAAWGWYMVSPKWSSLWPAASDPKPYGSNVTKAVLLMTDGDFNVAYDNGGELVAWPNPGATDVNIEGSSPNQAKKLCDNMKAAGVTIYSVAFMAPPAAEALLKDCSGGGNYYDAANTHQLKAAFRDIAGKLTSVSISQ